MARGPHRGGISPNFSQRMDMVTRQNRPGLSRKETHDMTRHGNEGTRTPTGPEGQPSLVCTAWIPGTWCMGGEVNSPVGDGPSEGLSAGRRMSATAAGG